MKVFFLKHNLYFIYCSNFTVHTSILFLYQSCTGTDPYRSGKPMNKKLQRDMEWGSERRLSLWYRSEISKVVSKRKGHLGKRSGSRQVIPFPLLLSSLCKSALIATCKKNQLCLSATLILSPVGSNCSHCCSAQTAQREGEANSWTQLLISVMDLWFLCFPPFLIHAFEITLMSEICLNTRKGMWKASSAPGKKVITQNCLKQDYSCNSSSQGTRG